jgi:hypothetical protein
MIAEDVEIDFFGGAERTTDAGTELPIAKIAFAATGVPVAADVGNIGAEAGTAHNYASVFKAKSAKSSVFALELQKLSVAKSSPWWAWWDRKKKLHLADDAPDFDAGRLMGEGDGDEDALPTMEDLELVDYC